MGMLTRPFAWRIPVPASCPLYHSVRAEITRRAAGVPASSQERLALLVTGMIGAQSCVLARVAEELEVLELTEATTSESIGRRLRRTLNDPNLTAQACCAELLTSLLASATEPLVLILDESSNAEHVHLLRLALAYRGGAAPVAWASWPQQQPLDEGVYWAAVDQVLAHAAALVPPEREVIVLADRAYAVPALVDRLAAYGWHWILRVTTGGAHRWRPRTGADPAAVGAETGLRAVVEAGLPQPGCRLRGSGHFAKKAGWRPAHLVGVWGRGHRESLVVLTDLPPRWSVLALYKRRFWIEAGFRADKTHGWNWEASQVRDLAHHQVLLVALAWAAVLALGLGATIAATRLAAQAHRRGQPTHARLSLATLGVRATHAWLIRGQLREAPAGLVWDLPQLHGPSWSAEWSAAAARRYIFGAPVRP